MLRACMPLVMQIYRRVSRNGSHLLFDLNLRLRNSAVLELVLNLFASLRRDCECTLQTAQSAGCLSQMRCALHSTGATSAVPPHPALPRRSQTSRRLQRPRGPALHGRQRAIEAACCTDWCSVDMRPSSSSTASSIASRPSTRCRTWTPRRRGNWPRTPDGAVMALLPSPSRCHAARVGAPLQR